jgi:hypothetical protein
MHVMKKAGAQYVARNCLDRCCPIGLPTEQGKSTCAEAEFADVGGEDMKDSEAVLAPVQQAARQMASGGKCIPA